MKSSTCNNHQLNRHALKRYYVIACSICIGAIVLAIFKASNASITNDEAWNYNFWIVKGFGFIWHDYSAANNHMLNTILVRLCCELFGPSEFAIRLPAIFGFLLFLISLVLLVRELIQNPFLRIYTILVISCHPYIIDFASCGRGYSLATGFSFLALYFFFSAYKKQSKTIFRIENSIKVPLASSFEFHVVASSICVGCAMAVLPIALNIFILLIVGSVFLYWGKGAKQILLCFAYLITPAVLIGFLTYLHVLSDMPSKMDFGAQSLLDSIANLLSTLTYETQAIVSDTGNPLYSIPVVSWKELPFPSWFYENIVAPATTILFLFFLLGSILQLFIVGFRSLNRLNAAPSFLLVSLVSIILIEYMVFGIKLPLYRTWYIYVPFIVLAGISTVDSLLRSLTYKVRTIALVCFFFLGSIFIINSVGKISFSTYREWPDQVLVLETITILSNEYERRLKQLDKQKISVGYPWPLHACFLFYKKMYGLNWMTIAQGRIAEKPCWDFILINSRMDSRFYKEYKSVKAFTLHKAELKVKPTN